MPKTAQKDRLEKLREQREELNTRIAKMEAQARERQRKERLVLLQVWGEVVEALLHSGELSPAQWRTHCEQHLTQGRNQELALRRLAAFSAPASEDKAAPSA